MLLFVGFALLVAAVYLVGEVVTAPSRERDESVRRAASYGRIRLPGGPERLKFKERVLAPATDSLARLVLRLNPKMSVETVRLRLLAAGLSDRFTPQSFLAAKAVGAVGGFFLGGLAGGAASGVGAGFLFSAGGAVLGFMAPGLLLSSRAKRRREEIKSQLPDALDLLAVSVEAGMGFDGAIAKLTEHMEGALAEEFGLTLNEMRIGEGRQEALKKMSDRVDAPEIAAFCRAIIQADQLGISLGRILRVQAADSRLRRQAAAEERAMKAPIKMLFPTVAFIFPAMFLVILGPAFLNIKKIF
jgi:tight adherence protein C